MAVGAGAGVSGGVLTPAEFAALFERASRRLWCVAVGITGDAAQAEDIVQDAAGIALGKIGQFDPGTSFDAWMAQIVRYVAMNERRRAARQRTRPVDPGTLASRPSEDHGGGGAGSPPVDVVGKLRPGQDAFDDALAGALGGLAETPRACLLLRTILGLPYAQIAEMLSIPEGTAMSHVHRARQSLRATLGERSRARPAAAGGAP